MGAVLMGESYTTPTGVWVDNDLPEVINATKVVSYTVRDVVRTIVEERESAEWVNKTGEIGGSALTLEVTLSDVMERICEWASDDLACGWGHTDDLTGVLFINADTNTQVEW